MNNTLKTLTDEIKAALITSIASKAVVDLIASTKSSKDTDAGSFKVIVSTSDVDRQGESVNQAGWDLTFYKSNPIVLWAHDYSALPIGVCLSIDVKDGKLVAEGKFAPADANPFAQQIRKLYDLGMINTTSVGFIPKEYDGQKQGLITKSELLEFSFVPVPANPYALRLNQIKELGIDMTMLKTKGIEVKEETETPPAPVTPPVEPTAPEVPPTTPPAEPAPVIPPATPEPQPADDIKSLHIKVDKIIVALGSLELAKGDKSSVETTATTRSKTSESLKEVNNFVETRTLLRQIDNSIETVLRNFNAAARIR